jgi:hypothetical protein
MNRQRILMLTSALELRLMLPITIVARLYGQAVTVSDLDIYWKVKTEFDGITAVILRRQTGMGHYANLVFDIGGTRRACEQSAHPDGCTLHYDVTSGNVLTANPGILYLTIELAFNSASSWAEVGVLRSGIMHKHTPWEDV